MTRFAESPMAGAPPEDLHERWLRPVLEAAERLAAPGPVVGRALALLEGAWTPVSIARCIGESPELSENVQNPPHHKSGA